LGDPGSEGLLFHGWYLRYGRCRRAFREHGGGYDSLVYSSASAPYDPDCDWNPYYFNPACPGPFPPHGILSFDFSEQIFGGSAILLDNDTGVAVSPGYTAYNDVGVEFNNFVDVNLRLVSVTGLELDTNYLVALSSDPVASTEPYRLKNLLDNYNEIPLDMAMARTRATQDFSGMALVHRSPYADLVWSDNIEGPMEEFMRFLPKILRRLSTENFAHRQSE